MGKRVRLTKKTRPSATSHVILDPGHPTLRRMEKIAAPFLRRRGGARWACLAIFFLALGLVEFCTGEAWNLPSEGTGLEVFLAGQPKGPVHWHWSILICCVHALTWSDTSSLFIVRTTTTTTTTGVLDHKRLFSDLFAETPAGDIHG